MKRPIPVFIGGINVAFCENFPDDVYSKAIDSGRVPEGVTCDKYGECLKTEDCLYKKYVRLLDACGLPFPDAKSAVIIDGIDVRTCKCFQKANTCKFWGKCEGNSCMFKLNALRDRVTYYKALLDGTAERIQNIQIVPYQRCETVKTLLDEIASDMKTCAKRIF